MKFEEVLAEDLITEKKKLSKKLLRKIKERKGKKPDFLKDKDKGKKAEDGGMPKDLLPGRERLVTGTIHKLEKLGINVSRDTVRNYITKKYNQWVSGDSGAKWIVKAGKVAKKLGFNIDNYKHGNVKGLPRGEKGRAYFFTCLYNGFVNHFEKGE